MLIIFLLNEITVKQKHILFQIIESIQNQEYLIIINIVKYFVLIAILKSFN